MPEKGKMGRNPLEKLKNHSSNSRVLEAVLDKANQTSTLEKIRELKIQVDWPELYDATVGKQVKKLSRLLTRF